MGSGRGVVGPDGDDTNALDLREIEDIVARRRLIFAVDHDELIPGRYTANLWSVVRVDVISGRFEFNPARRDPHVMTVSSAAQSELSRTQVPITGEGGAKPREGRLLSYSAVSGRLRSARRWLLC
jgi:hypothetical protein